MEMTDRIKASVKDAQKILVGIGECFDGMEAARAKEAYSGLSRLLDGEDYYVLTFGSAGILIDNGINCDRIVAPFDDEYNLSKAIDDEDAESAGERIWNTYNEWLARTLNRSLCILELGVGIKYPTIMRWPFEKVTMINNKAQMFRVHPSLYHATEEIKDKCESVMADPVELLSKI